VRDYKTLNSYVKAFAEGYISLLIIKGEGGLGKTYAIKQIMKEKSPLIFNGHATPLSIYLRLFSEPTARVVFDDVDSMLSNKITVALLKQLCETNKVKEIRYDTTARINEMQVPSSIKCTNKVCLLCNDMKKFGKNMKALLTRAVYLEFVPTKEEIMQRLKQFPELDLEIYEFLQKNIDYFFNLNFRLYLKAKELKEAGVDWQEYAEGEMKVNRELELIMDIMDLPKKERNQIWKEKTGRHVRTLQRKIKEIQQSI